MEVIECKKCAGIIDIKKIKGNVCVCEFCGTSHILSGLKEKLEGTYIPDFLYYYNQMYLNIEQQEKAIEIIKEEMKKIENIERGEYKKLYEKKYSIVTDILMNIIGGIIGVLGATLISGIISFIIHTIFAILSLFGQCGAVYDKLHGGTIWSIFWIGTIVLSMLWIAFLTWTEILTYRQEKKLLKENEILIKENQEIEKRNEEMNLKKNNLLRLYKQEEYELNLILIQSKKEIVQLNRMECIYPKYLNNYIFLCSFYEYFKSGRCNKLEGADGAYNLLESDIRAKVIPSQDDDESRQKIKKYNSIIQQNSKKTEAKINLFKHVIREMPHSINSVKDYKPLCDFNDAYKQRNEECWKWRKENN